MDLDCIRRDELLSGRLLSDYSLVSRLAKPYRENNVRQIVANLLAVIEELDEDCLLYTSIFPVANKHRHLQITDILLRIKFHQRLSQLQ